MQTLNRSTNIVYNQDGIYTKVLTHKASIDSFVFFHVVKMSVPICKNAVLEYLSVWLIHRDEIELKLAKKTVGLIKA